jgi:ribosomal protein S18 acetylase RimI-like enzyme
MGKGGRYLIFSGKKPLWDIMTGLERAGKAVYLRPVSIADSADVLEAILQGGLGEAVPGSDGVRSPEDCRAMLAGLIDRASSGLELHFAICLREGREKAKTVGMCALYEFDRPNHSSSIGYWISRPYRRHGYGKEAVGLLSQIAFSDLGLRRLNASFEPSNEPSSRLLRSLGFREDRSKTGTTGTITFSLEQQ